MKQQINLYQLDRKKPGMVLSFMQMLQIVGILAAVLFMMTLYKGYDYFHKKKLLTELEKKQNEVNKQLVITSGKVTAPQTREEILTEIKQLQEQVTINEEILFTLVKLQSGRTLGFSRYLKALAEQTQPGVWLVNFAFQEGGEFITLKGNALKAAEVPKFLEGLGSEPVFAGKSFQVFKVATDEKTQHLHFILETVQSPKT